MVQAPSSSRNIRWQCFIHAMDAKPGPGPWLSNLRADLAIYQEALDPAQYHTIAISNRGAGDSDRGQTEEDYSVPAFARDLLHALHTLGVQDFTLVGHSMGGATAAQFALDIHTS